MIIVSPIRAGRVIAICIPAIIFPKVLCAATPKITVARPAEAIREIPNFSKDLN